MSEDLKLLYPDEGGQRERNYIWKKSAYVLVILFIGDALALCISLKSRLNREEAALESLSRNPYGEGEKTVLLSAKLGMQGQDTEEILEISLEEREYTEQEAYDFIDQAIAELPGVIFTGETGPDYVSEDLTLVKSLPDIPVTIEWEPGDYRLMDGSGHITASELPEEGELCVLTARICCQEYVKEWITYVRIFPGELNYGEQLRKQLEEALRDSEQQSRTEEAMELPHEVDGVPVVWMEKKNDDSVKILLLAAALAAGSFFAMDRDLHKKAEERKQTLVRDYPELVSKLVLFMGAGMTIRGAFHRIALDYERRGGGQCEALGGKEGRCAGLRHGGGRSEALGGKEGCAGLKRGRGRAVYEEIIRTCHEMDSGISEFQAYLNLGKRCQEQHYIRLSMLLSQNLKKGNAGLAELLEREAGEAFEERKRNARKYGEEAGTKLLLPMMILLLIVMVVIMVPAFRSLG